MSLSDYFNEGREAQRKYEEKQKKKFANAGKPKKSSPFSIGGVIKGAGVIYEMIYPYLPKPRTPRQNIASTRREDNQFIKTIKSDISALVTKLQKKSENWEEYRRFSDLAKGKR